MRVAEEPAAVVEDVPVPEEIAVALADPHRQHIKLFRRIRLWLETPGHLCQLCCRPTVLVTCVEYELGPDGRLLYETGRGRGQQPSNAATIEHKDSRWDGPRSYRGEEILACHECNHRHAKEALDRWKAGRPGRSGPSPIPTLARFMAATEEGRDGFSAEDLRLAWVEAVSSDRRDWARDIYERLGGNEVEVGVRWPRS